MNEQVDLKHKKDAEEHEKAYTPVQNATAAWANVLSENVAAPPPKKTKTIIEGFHVLFVLRQHC